MIKERCTIYMFTNDIDDFSHTVAARYVRSILYSLLIIVSVVRKLMWTWENLRLRFSLTTGCVNFAIVLTCYLHTAS